MKFLTLVVIGVPFFFNIVKAQAQTPIQFQHSYGHFNYNFGMCIKQLADTGYVILANVSDAETNTNIYLFKIDKYGTFEWDMLFEDTAIFWAEKMVMTPDSGFIITGYTNKIKDAGYNIFLLKTNALGQKEWLRFYGGHNWDFGMDVAVDSSGNFFVTGSTYSFSDSDKDVYILKLDAYGDTIWTRTYGGLQSDAGRSIYVCQNQDIVVAGYTNSFGNGHYDALMLRYDNNGNYLWSNTYGGDYDDKVFDVKELEDGSFILIGYTESFGNNSAYYYMVKTFANGQLHWHKIDGWSGGHIGNDKGYVLDLTYDGGFVFLGSSTWNVYQDLFLFKTDISGNWMFSTTYGGMGTETPGYILQTLDSCFIIVGTSTYYGNHLNNIYIVKTGLTGTSIPYNNISEKYTRIYHELSIFPNPFSDYATVSFEEPCEGICTFEVFNSMGQRVKKKHIQSNSFYLSSENLNSGIYFYRLSNNLTTKSTGKFVVH